MSTAGIVAAMLFGGAVSTAFAAASLTPLGYLPGGDGSGAKGVSADGSLVVGWNSSDSGFGREAFRGTSGGGMVGLGDLPGGAFSGEARGISADGSVIVGYGTSASGQEAFRWTSDGGMVGLGFLPGGGYSEANGVSADGSVIVGLSNSASGWEAFRWTSGGGMMGLGDLPGGSFDSEAVGVSANGSVIVGNSISVSGAGGWEAFRWTSGGGTVGLGRLPGGSWFGSLAYGVSGDGSVVVGWNYPDSDCSCGYEAFRWTSDGGMVGLGPLPGGAYSAPYGVSVSADGSVIVGFGTSDSGQEAYRWTSDGGMERLWDVLLAEGIDPAADGWTDLAAHGISADGNTIVGSGQRNGTIEAFVAVIPISSPLQGDFNGDNVVDAADLAQWQGDFGVNGDSDVDNDNDSDGADFLVWQRQFGSNPAGAPAADAVPEPATFVLLIVAAAAWCQRRRRTV